MVSGNNQSSLKTEKENMFDHVILGQVSSFLCSFVSETSGNWMCQCEMKLSDIGQGEYEWLGASPSFWCDSPSEHWLSGGIPPQRTAGLQQCSSWQCSELFKRIPASHELLSATLPPFRWLFRSCRIRLASCLPACFSMVRARVGWVVVMGGVSPDRHPDRHSNRYINHRCVSVENVQAFSFYLRRSTPCGVW